MKNVKNFPRKLQSKLGHMISVTIVVKIPIFMRTKCKLFWTKLHALLSQTHTQTASVSFLARFLCLRKLWYLNETVLIDYRKVFKWIISLKKKKKKNCIP